jgi:hypothetical protein
MFRNSPQLRQTFDLHCLHFRAIAAAINGLIFSPGPSSISAVIIMLSPMVPMKDFASCQAKMGAFLHTKSNAGTILEEVRDCL